jgi:hypothetical protein
MIGRTQRIDDPGALAIPAERDDIAQQDLRKGSDKLVAAMRSAVADDDSLDKDLTEYSHVFDSTRLAASYFTYNYDLKQELPKPLVKYED